MSRVSPIPPERMSPEQRKVYDESVAMGTPTGATGGPYSAYIRNPEYMRLHRTVGQYVRKCSLSGRVRQMLVLQTIAHWDSKYPWARQVQASLREGLDQPIIDAIGKGQDPKLTSPQEQAAYQFGKELLSTKRVSEATYKRALELFGEVGVLDMVVTVGSFTTTALTANAFDLDPPKD